MRTSSAHYTLSPTEQENAVGGGRGLIKLLFFFWTFYSELVRDKFAVVEALRVRYVLQQSKRLR